MWIQLVTVCLLFATTVDCNPCKFNTDCDCQTSILLTTTVHCYNVSGEFPTFTIYNSTLIEAISVIGDFNYVPAYAFIALQFVPLGISMTIGRSIFSTVPLFVDENAFQLVPIENLSFYQVTLPSVPTLAMVDRKLKNLNFELGNLEVVTDYAFEGLTVTDGLHFVDNGLRSILPDAFTGMNSNGTVLKVFYADGNPLNEVPQALKKLKIEELFLLRCNISALTDNCFCSSSTSCAIVNLDLTGNSINAISTNSLQYMPLQKVSFYSTNLATVPSALSQLGSTLQKLDLRSNGITDISTSSVFAALRSLISINLDYNPITKVFYSTNLAWGSKPMTDLQFSGLNSLATIDISFIYGMSSLQRLTITSCPFLTDVQCSYCSYSYLPASFTTLNLSRNDVRNLDSLFRTRIEQYPNTIIDLSYNYNFNCNSGILWMTNYVNCEPVKIYTTETFCANTKLPLSLYLRLADGKTCT